MEASTADVLDVACSVCSILTLNYSDYSIKLLLEMLPNAVPLASWCAVEEHYLRLGYEKTCT
jgi:hypothetical protein